MQRTYVELVEDGNVEELQSSFRDGANKEKGPNQVLGYS